eukprot:Opistho-2@33186
MVGIGSHVIMLTLFSSESVRCGDRRNGRCEETVEGALGGDRTHSVFDDTLIAWIANRIHVMGLDECGNMRSLRSFQHDEHLPSRSYSLSFWCGAATESLVVTEAKDGMLIALSTDDRGRPCV